MNRRNTPDLVNALFLIDDVCRCGETCVTTERTLKGDLHVDPISQNNPGIFTNQSTARSSVLGNCFRTASKSPPEVAKNKKQKVMKIL